MSFFRALTRPPPVTGPAEQSRAVTLQGVATEILVRRHPRARRIKLQIDSKRGLPVLTLPSGVSEREGLAFLDRNAGWVLTQIDQLPQRLGFAPGVMVPYRGSLHTVRHDAAARGGVLVDGTDLVVTGGLDHLPRRLTDFFRHQAKSEIRPLVREYAALLGRIPGQVSIRDQRTRWGSCAANGNLSFSWRLILAPPDVLNYVVCHEVAHLVHMDHSRAFWKTVASVCPDHKQARAWLADEGTRLHRIG